MAVLLPVAAGILTGCGYHVSGKADLLPQEIATIAVPAFQNGSTRYKLTQQMAAAVTREFVGRTRYRIVANPEDADATLHGVVVNFFAYPTVFDQEASRAAGMQVIVVLDIRLVEKNTGKTLYQNSGMTVQNRYEITSDQAEYFEESDTALRRLSADVARMVTSAVLENF
jgi:outer membrane lipopolysaccharide assembly protein LptE/RlpB